ncbi:MAG: MFS transporter [Leucobacter sp.]
MRKERFASVQKRTMFVLIITQIVGTLGLGVAPTIAVLIAGDVTQNEAWAGLARTASTLGAALLGIPLGNLAAKFGRRVALSCGWWLAAVGTAILVVAAEKSLIVPLFAGLLLLGAGAATSLQSRFTATDLAKPKNKARSLALIVWVGTIGSVIGPNIGIPGAYVGEMLGLSVYAASFLLATIFLVVAGTIIFVMLRPDPLLVLTEHTVQTSAVPQTRKKGSMRSAISLLRTNKPARIAVIAILVGQVVMASIMTMTPVHIMHEGGTVGLVGVTISMHVLGMFAFSPLSGWVVDKFGHRVSMWVGIGIFMLSLVFAAGWQSDMRFIMASLFFLGLGWSFVNIAGSALFTSAVPDEGRASSQGGVDALSNLFGATASFLAGPLLALTDFKVLAVLAMFVLVPLGFVLLRRIPLVEDTSNT